MYIINEMKYIFDLGTAIALIILIAIRFFSDEGSWMVVIQYIGLGIAYADLSVSSLLVTVKTKKLKKILITVIVGMIIFIIAAILGSLGIVEGLADQRAMDIITLGTLLISLPQKLYLKLLEEREAE